MGQWYYNLVLAINFISAISIIVLVLLQHGKGADMGASFGSGSSGSLFGATGAANLLSRLTAILAVVFFSSCLALAFISIRAPRSVNSIMLQSGAKVEDKTGSPAASTPLIPSTKTSEKPETVTTPTEKNSSLPAIPK